MSKLLFVLNAVIALALGLVLVFAPVMILDQFRMDKVATVVYVARVLGAVLASLGVVLWFAKDVDDAAQKGLSMATLAGTILVIVVTIIGLSSGVIRVNGWIPLVVEVLFALGYAFVLFLQPRMK